MFQHEVEMLALVDHPALLGFRRFVPFRRAAPPAILTEQMDRESLQSLLNAEREEQAPPDGTETT
jgi:hypothetical protein